MKTLKSMLAVVGIAGAALFAFASPAVAGGGGDGDGDGQNSSNNWGAFNGDQIDISPQLGLNVCGNAIAILGLAFADDSTCVNHF